MAEGVFTIQELSQVGSITGQTDGGGERFDWTSAETPVDGARGGARACPVQPWVMGGTLQTVRTDYSGSSEPSEQVMGWRLEPQTLSGRWDDRYNFPGYAQAEMDRFEAMCGRGNMVRISFGPNAFNVLITKAVFDYRRAWDIGYSFTTSTHKRPGVSTLDSRSPVTVPSPAVAFDDVDVAVAAALEFHEEAPLTLLGGTLANDTETNLAQLSLSRNQLAATLDNRDLSPTDRPVDSFMRLATQFRQVQSDAFEAILDLVAVRSDIELAARTAMATLDFEAWSRSMRYALRLAGLGALIGDRAASERAQPDATKLYRPSEGESLYAISRRFYGTPHAWRLIADRNNLQTFNLTGDEVLIIPERGEG